MFKLLPVKPPTVKIELIQDDSERKITKTDIDTVSIDIKDILKFYSQLSVSNKQST